MAQTPEQKQKQQAKTAVQLLEEKRIEFVLARKRELINNGLDPVDAERTAKEEFVKEFAEPLANVYGGYEEKKKAASFPIVPGVGEVTDLARVEPSMPGDKPSIIGAVRPKATLTSEEKQRAKKSTIEDLVAKEEKPKSGKIDFGVISKMLEEQGATREQATLEAYALQQAFKERRKAVSPAVTDQQVLQQTINQINLLEGRLADKDSYIKEEISKGLADPIYQAFRPGVKESEGVPDLSPEQGAYYKAYVDYETKKAKQKLKKELRSEEKEVIQLPRGQVVSMEDFKSGKLPADVMEQATEAINNPENISKRAYSDEEIEAEMKKRAPELFQDLWWMDPEKKKQVLLDPEKFKEENLFETKSAFGTTIESAPGYALRSLLVIPNATAGLVSKGLRTASMSEEDLKLAAAYREQTSGKGYGASPILANIKENKGFAGESTDLIEALGLEGQEAKTMFAAGVIADLLDPTFELIGGVGRGAKLAFQTSRASKAVTGAYRPLQAAGKGIKALGSELYQAIPFVSAPSFDPGDVRNVIAQDLNASARARAAHRTATLSNPAVTTAQLLPALEKEFGKGNAYVKALKAKGIPASAVDSYKALGGTGSFAKLDNLIEDIVTNNLADVVESGLTKLPKYVDAQKLERTARTYIRFFNDIQAEKIFSSSGSLIDKLGQLKQANPDMFSQIMSLVDQTKLFDEVSNIVATATKDMVGLDNVVALTKNTYINKADLPKILEEFKTTKAYDVLERIKKSKVVVDDITGKAFYELPGGRISVEGVRRIIDESLDTIAEALQRNIPAQSITKLETTEQLRLLQPLTARSFASGLYGKGASLLRRQLGVIENTLSPAQRTLVKKFASELDRADLTLRQYMRSAPGDNTLAKLNWSIMEDIFKDPENVSYLMRIGLKWAIDSMFYVDKPVVKLLDSIGSDVSITSFSSILTKKGKKTFDELLNVATKGALNLEKPLDSLQILVTSIKQMLQDPEMINPSFFGKIDSLIETTGKNAGLIPEEIQVGLFYKILTERKKAELIREIVSEQTGQGFATLDELTNQSFARSFNEWLSSVGISSNPETIRKLSNSIVAKQVENLLVKGDVEEDIEMILREISQTGVSRQLADLISDPAVSRETLLYVSELVTRANDSAQVLAGKGVGALLDDKSKLFKKIQKLLDEPTISDLSRIVGKENAQAIRSEIYKAGQALANEVTTLQKAGKQSKAKALIDFGSKVIDYASSFRYMVILNARIAFHTVNMLTAPFISYVTTGRVPFVSDIINRSPGVLGIKSLQTLKRGLKGPGNVNWHTIAIVDKAGRPYTHGEIFDAVVKGGGTRSLNTINTAIDGLKLPGTDYLNEASRAFKESAQVEDTFFRLQAAYGELAKGRSLDEAVATARASMYDVGNLFDFERKANKYFLFYSWWRENTMNLIRSLGNPKALGRYALIGKLKRDYEMAFKKYLEDQGIDSELVIPDYGQTRIPLAVKKWGDKTYVLMSPSIPPVDAAAAIINLLTKGGITEKAAGFLDPTYQNVLGLGGDERELTQVPPELIVAMSALFTTEEIESYLSSALGGPIYASPAKPEQGAVKGYIYKLDNPEARSRMEALMSIARASGITTGGSDYTKIASGKGTSAETMPGILGGIAYAGGIRPIAVKSPEQIETYDAYARLDKLENLLKNWDRMSEKERQAEMDDLQLSGGIVEEPTDKQEGKKSTKPAKPKIAKPKIAKPKIAKPKLARPKIR